MKKGLVFISLFLLLNLSIFASAQTTWQITDPQGICGGPGKPVPEGMILSFTSECIGYSSSTECESNSNCHWEQSYEEFMNNSIRVNEGWNLLWGLTYPSQISSGINPNSVKAIYGLQPITKEYLPVFLSSEHSLPTPTSDVAISNGYHLSSQSNNLNWVYFNESGNIKYRIIDLKQITIDAFGENNPNVWIYDPFLNEFLTAGISMISGWNFLGITPTFFYDYGSAGDPDDWGKKNYFMLNDFVGNCDIEEAYFYGGTIDNPDITSEWVEVGINDQILDAELFRVIIVKVAQDCILGKTNHQKICLDTDGLIRTTVKGNVTIKDSDGNVLDFEEDSCVLESPDGNRKILEETYCQYDENGDVSIGKLSFWEFPDIDGSICKTCNDGACTI